jgi:hypothetical protein
MTRAYCFLSTVAMRRDPSDRAEMVNQLLEGDTFQILQQEEKWSFIRCDWDGYEGWVDNKQWKPTTQGPNMDTGHETSPSDVWSGLSGSAARLANSAAEYEATIVPS